MPKLKIGQGWLPRNHKKRMWRIVRGVNDWGGIKYLRQDCQIRICSEKAFRAWIEAVDARDVHFTQLPPDFTVKVGKNGKHIRVER